MALSLPLWQTRTTYPRIPLFDAIPAFPRPLDTVFCLAFAAAFGILALRPKLKRLATLWLIATVFLAVQDQSRLQPWFVEYVLLLAASVFSKSEEAACDCCRIVLPAIYFWTGVHKMNDTFSTKLFPWIVSSFSTPAFARPIHFLGMMVPYLEMGMGLALLFPRTRRAGVMAIVAMHLLLLALLGPWSLGWNNVVWPWNLAMVVLVPCLFWQSNISAKALLAPRGAWLRKAFLVFVIALPPLSLAGLWDTYPSFALYSGNPLIGTVALTPEAFQRLDDSTKTVAESVGDGYLIRFDDWSLAAMNVPAYPAERVLRRVALSFCTVHARDNDVTYVLEKPSGWFYRPGWHTIERSGDLCRSSPP